LSIHYKILKKTRFPQKVLSSESVLNIDYDQKYFLRTKFLKVHVTLKTGVMDAEHSDLP